MKIISLFFIVLFVLFNEIQTDSYFGRDWSIFEKVKSLIRHEIEKKTALGLTSKQILKDHNLFTHGLKPTIVSEFAVSPSYTMDDINVVTGKGIFLKPNKNNKTKIEIKMPFRKLNTCGLMLKLTKSASVDYPESIKIYWKETEITNYDILSRPDNGQESYKLKLEGRVDHKALFFDSVPAQYFELEFTTTSGKPINMTLASINTCIFNSRHLIKHCGEKLHNNPRFLTLPHGEPISIKCPVDCIRSWPCWGYKLYSSDSPICWTATQTFGRWGNGEFSLYKIKQMFYFTSQANMTLTHGIYCRRSTTTYPGYTFTRKNYDLAKLIEKKILALKKKRSKN